VKAQLERSIIDLSAANDKVSAASIEAEELRGRITKREDEIFWKLVS